MTLSSFSSEGLNVGNNDSNMSYLYGMSDFWAVMFEDSEKVNLLLEATSHQCSDIYSKFLQLTSTLSLETIQTTVGYQTSLVLISDSDLVAGKINTFKLSKPILNAKFIANRPFLPTSSLEKDVHFYISEDGTEITLYSDITQIGFPSRILSTGEKQYALWFSDTEVDEQLISDYYGKLIQVSPEVSTENFRNFIYGLYYMYTQGPSLEMVRKGLNLALGIPLARGDETVLDIRKYLDTDQWLVTTDINSYLIPYGLEPTVSVGDSVILSQELALWIEVKDYINDGDWWINLQIPPTLLPYIPDGEDNRYASTGSYADYIMRTYLKKHSFLVNVNVTDFKNIQYFEELSSIINRVKPTYTSPIYIWSVPINPEVLTLEDETSFQRRDKPVCENLSIPIERFRRDSTAPVGRGCGNFIRMNVPHQVAELLGSISPILNYPMPFETGTVRGFIDANNQVRDETGGEKGWLKAVFNRFSEVRINRDKLSFSRGTEHTDVSGTGYYPYSQSSFRAPTLRCVPLYATTKYELQARLNTINFQIPDDKYIFTVFKPYSGLGPINSTSINSTYYVEYFEALVEAFDELFIRVGSPYLGPFMPKPGYDIYTPNITDLKRTDYLLISRIYENTYGVYWVTSNTSDLIPGYFMIESSDKLSIDITATMSRGMAASNCPAYLLRGANAVLNYNNTDKSINSMAVNRSESFINPGISCVYSDDLNTSVTIDRSGSTIILRREIV